MPITINGSGTVTGISAGGLPDGVITTDDIAANAVTQAKRSEQLTRDTAKSATGTSVDFTGIPSWVKRITLILDGVSTSGLSNPIAQLGSNSFTTSGYLGTASYIPNGGSPGTGIYTAGIGLGANASGTYARYGILTLVNVSGNGWVGSYFGGLTGTTETSIGGGGVTLSGTLDRIRITTVNGTDTFDAGSINILYE